MSDAVGVRPSRARRLAGGLALAAAATALALGAAELAVRIALPDTAAPQQAPRAPLPPELPALHTVFDLASPNVRGTYKGVVHRTDRFGARGPDVPLVPPPRTFRIALIGDSIAMGEGVDEDETYAARAARLLAADDARHAYEVVNLGVSGATAPQSARRLETLGALYHPQLVVYGYTLNDIEGSAYRPAPRPERIAHKRLLARFERSPSALLRAVWPRLVVAWSAFRPLPGSYERELADNYRANPEAWREVEAALDRIAAESRALGACALLFVHPRLQDLTWLHAFTPFYRQVADAARARGFHVAVALDALRGESAALLRTSELDAHPNPEAHRLLAQALYDAIRALPPECLAARAAPGAPRG